jgi:hypothetical protein
MRLFTARKGIACFCSLLGLGKEPLLVLNLSPELQSSALPLQLSQFMLCLQDLGV